jgi:polyribonucleotide nucleotidyltransferase
VSIVTKNVEVAGRRLSIETGRVAEQANGAVIVRQGDSVVLSTVVMSKEPREGIDFFPLTCDYEEKLYAAGKIPGAFMRREGRPSETAILASRLTDRPLRPLFPEGFRLDIQVVSTVLSVDQENDPTILSINGASTAIVISDVPWAGPVGAVRMGLLDGKVVVNPPMSRIAESELDLVVAGTADAILMVEAGAKGVSEQTVLEALDMAHDAIRLICAAQLELREQVGREKRDFIPTSYPEQAVEVVNEYLAMRLDPVLFSSDKAARESAVDELRRVMIMDLGARFPEHADIMGKLFDKKVKDRVRERVVEEGVRIDGRGLKDVRQISVEVGVLPRTHGSGLFTRGQTQALTIATLGSMSDQQKLDGLTLADEFKRYMHHYNFPPFSVGESRPLRGPGRREIGHGALAERALLAVIPPVEEWPYTMRLVSEILSSNGSTSMASVCGSTLALMDAGVPIKSPVAGIAMGLVTREGKHAVLTDIQGVEDNLGDMDFKVAGTRDGITALQMDIKIKGLTREILAQALEQAREARLFVLDKMLAVLPRPRAEMSAYAPRITTIMINPDKIRDVIGPGGKTIRKITEETGAQIDVEDDGRVFIAAVDQAAGQRAIDWIKGLTDEVEVGKIYRGKVVRIMAFGAFVEVLPGQDGLVHISKLTDHRVERVEEVCNVGDEIVVKAVEVDSQGRLNLSRQAAIEELTAQGLPIDEKINPEVMAAALAVPQAPRESSFGGRDRGGRNGGGRNRGRRD